MFTLTRRVLLLNREILFLLIEKNKCEYYDRCTKEETFENSCIIGPDQDLTVWAESILTVAMLGITVGIVGTGDDVTISWDGPAPDEFILTKLSN